MKIFLQLFFFLTLFACSSSVIKIDDKVRNEVTYLWKTQKSTSSKINKIHRYFNINIERRRTNSEYICINIRSTFVVTQPDYFDTTYIVLPNQNLPFPLQKVMENIQYKENRNHIATTTNTKTDVNIENTTTKVPIKDSSIASSSNEQKTESKTKTTTTTNVTNRVTTEILDKIKSERQFLVNVKSFKYALKSPSFKIRLYAQNDDDFWDINFTAADMKKLNQLLYHIADNQ